MKVSPVVTITQSPIHVAQNKKKMCTLCRVVLRRTLPILLCKKAAKYYRINHKHAPINVQRGQVGPSPHPIASTYER